MNWCIIESIRAQVDFSLRNKNGETALMCAARFGSKPICRLLLEHLRHLDMDGYFLRQRNRFGLTPLEIARSENLEAAKVITKHLINYGPHTPGSVLARSVSHHSLHAANFRPHGPATAASRRAIPTELLDEYISPSDYDSDVPLMRVGAAAGRRPTLVGATPGMRRPYNDYQAYYDPKAAEFSQYLLEQQEQQQQHGAAGRRTAAGLLSDDDQDEAEFAPRAGPLMRSRSCILGPAGAPSSGAAGVAKKGPLDQHHQGGAGSSKMGGGGASGWQDQSSGGPGAG